MTRVEVSKIYDGARIWDMRIKKPGGIWTHIANGYGRAKALSLAKKRLRRWLKQIEKLEAEGGGV